MTFTKNATVFGFICIVIVVIAQGTFLQRSAQAADVIIMNLGFGAPQDSDHGLFAKRLKGRIEDYSNGTIEVKIRCCDQISNEDDAFRAMQLGTVDSFIISANNISRHWPLMDVTVLPYIFENNDHFDRVTGGEVGDFIKEKLQADTSVHLLSFGAVYYRDFYNSKRPINTMADMKGLKVRTPKNEVMLATFRAFGAEPVPLAWSETPTALQTGTVDGSDNGTSFIKSMKFYEFEPYLVILENFSVVAPFFASDAFMKRLSDDQRAAVLRAATEVGREHNRARRADREDIRTWLVEKGGMTRTDPDRTAFIAAARRVQQDFADKRGADFIALLEKVRSAAQ